MYEALKSVKFSRVKILEVVWLNVYMLVDDYFDNINIVINCKW